MINHPFRPHHAPGARPQRGAALPWVFFGFLAVAGFFLLSEHRAHVMGALPFLLLAACPLMHFFHGRHGRHGSADGHRVDEPRGDGSADPGDGTGRPTRPDAPRPPHRH